MRHYLIVWHESDGNDCTVYDTSVEAPSEQGALSILAYNIERDLNYNKVPYSDDGSELGYFFDCYDDCPEDCDGHGGIALRGVEAFETYQEARAARSFYYSTYDCVVVGTR